MPHIITGGLQKFVQLYLTGIYQVNKFYVRTFTFFKVVSRY